MTTDTFEKVMGPIRANPDSTAEYVTLSDYRLTAALDTKVKQKRDLIRLVDALWKEHEAWHDNKAKAKDIVAEHDAVDTLLAELAKENEDAI